MSRVASGLLSWANVIIPSVTPCWGPEHSLWPERTLVVLIAWRTEPEVPRTRILAIDCCVCVSEWSPAQSKYPSTIYDMNVVQSNVLGRWSIFRFGSIVAWSNKDYHSRCRFNEFAKQRYVLIQSIRDSYVSPLHDIRLACLQRHESVLWFSRDYTWSNSVTCIHVTIPSTIIAGKGKPLT